MVGDERQRESRDEQAAVRRMIDAQLMARGIQDPRVLEAMQRVPRHEFVPAWLSEVAYADRALPLPCEQSISQPYVVAYMCEAAGLEGHECVLEVGAGCGYGAAVLAQLCRHVDTLERLPELAVLASENLQRVGVSNVAVHLAEGSHGWRLGAPYDAIVVTAAAAQTPPALLDQLAPGGRLIIPIGRTDDGQRMTRLTLGKDGLREEDLGSFAFVPLVVGRDETSETPT